MRVWEQFQRIRATSDLPPHHVGWTTLSARFFRFPPHPKKRFFEPILFFLCQKEKNGFNLPRKERGHSANRSPKIFSEDFSLYPSVAPDPTSRKVSALCASPFGVIIAHFRHSIRRGIQGQGPWPLEGVRGNHSEGSPERFFFCQAFSFWRPKKKMPSASLSPKRERKEWGRKHIRRGIQGRSPEPNCDPAERSQFGKEEGASGYGAFGVSRKCSAARFF